MCTDNETDSEYTLENIVINMFQCVGETSEHLINTFKYAQFPEMWKIETSNYSY